MGTRALLKIPNIQMNAFYIRNLEETITKDTIISHFSSFGKILECEFKLNSNFESVEKMAKVVTDTQKSLTGILKIDHYFGGKKVKLEVCSKNEENQFSDIVENRICVFKLPKWINKEEFKSHFIHFGKILKVYIKHNKAGRSNHGFITFKTKEGVRNSLKAKNINISDTISLSVVAYKQKKKARGIRDGLKGGHCSDNNDGSNFYSPEKELNIGRNGSKKIHNSKTTKHSSKISLNQRKTIIPDKLRTRIAKIEEENPHIGKITNHQELDLFYYNLLEEKKRLEQEKTLINYSSIVKRFSKRINLNHKDENIVLKQLDRPEAVNNGVRGLASTAAPATVTQRTRRGAQNEIRLINQRNFSQQEIGNLYFLPSPTFNDTVSRYNWC